MLKWVVCLVDDLLTMSLVKPILAQEVFQPYNNPRSYTTYWPGGQAYQPQPDNNHRGSAFGPGIQIYQNYNKPWNSTPYGSAEQGYQQNNNQWGTNIVTPLRR